MAQTHDTDGKGERCSIEWIEYYPMENFDNRKLLRSLATKSSRRRLITQRIEDFRTPQPPESNE